MDRSLLCDEAWPFSRLRLSLVDHHNPQQPSHLREFQRMFKLGELGAFNPAVHTSKNSHLASSNAKYLSFSQLPCLNRGLRRFPPPSLGLPPPIIHVLRHYAECGALMRVCDPTYG
ncbi:hypothetical protein K443DRAFT_686173 [Laccaria amethystina LaAM-08-1]|uniref:Uncharacterized protein n=1 Tax=Laccaria amethystina LaAM-08-1 TaxID=1095629 RepID=A0A0C9X114_9AGAR|nr:hypothetical protein K443DRAFT_686173 [Laccaria amethystina LaAM-08-1]